MPGEATTKLLVGSLMAGAAVITGDVTLLATAGAVGVNWASEALGQRLGDPPGAGSPLAQAGGRALRKALADLEKQFRTSVSASTERRSFALLRDSAGAVLDPAYPVGAASLADIQRSIAASLDDLLHGHNPQEVAFLRAHLIAAVARRFREELDSDDAAWRAFHGRLIAQLHARAAQPAPPADLAPLLASVADQQRALDALRDGDSALDQRLTALHALIARIEQGQGAATTSIGGSQTTISGSVNGPVLSGTFSGPVTITTGGQPAMQQPPSAESPGEERQALIREKRRRLHQRELTAARYGISTPPEVAIEIEDLKREIAALERGPAAPAPTRDRPAAPGAQPVLAIFAEPAGLSRTEWEEEARALRGLLLPFESQFSLRELANITPEELFQALLTIRPGMLHFQGHGTTDGLIFEDTQGGRYRVTWQALMGTLAACESLTCVVLNACDSHVHAQVGAQRFHLITTPGSVSSEATRAFTQGFYAALRAGRSVPLAHRDGCNLLDLKGIARAEWPQLTAARGAL